MKKISSLMLVLFTTIMLSAQALLTIAKTSEGIYKITYNDAAKGWAFFNPNSQPIGVYIWSNAADNSANTGYFDNWNNIPIAMTWDGTNYSGTINLITHSFNGTVIPAGTTVNQLHFLFTDSPAGNNAHQTADFNGTQFGFTSSTIPTMGVSNTAAKAKSAVVAGKLYTAARGNVSLSVYEMSGKLVKTMNVKADGSAIDLNVANNGLYLVKITNGSENEVVKFAK